MYRYIFLISGLLSCSPINKNNPTAEKPINNESPTNNKDTYLIDPNYEGTDLNYLKNPDKIFRALTKKFNFFEQQADLKNIRTKQDLKSWGVNFFKQYWPISAGKDLTPFDKEQFLSFIWDITYKIARNENDKSYVYTQVINNQNLIKEIKELSDFADTGSVENNNYNEIKKKYKKIEEYFINVLAQGVTIYPKEKKENFTNKISSKLSDHYHGLLSSNNFIKDLYDVYKNFFAYNTYLFDNDSKSIIYSTKYRKDYEYRYRYSVKRFVFDREYTELLNVVVPHEYLVSLDDTSQDPYVISTYVSRDEHEKIFTNKDVAKIFFKNYQDKNLIYTRYEEVSNKILSYIEKKWLKVGEDHAQLLDIFEHFYEKDKKITELDKDFINDAIKTIKKTVLNPLLQPLLQEDRKIIEYIKTNKKKKTIEKMLPFALNLSTANPDQIPLWNEFLSSKRDSLKNALNIFKSNNTLNEEILWDDFLYADFHEKSLLLPFLIHLNKLLTPQRIFNEYREGFGYCARIISHSFFTSISDEEIFKSIDFIFENTYKNLVEYYHYSHRFKGNSLRVGSRQLGEHFTIHPRIDLLFSDIFLSEFSNIIQEGIKKNSGVAQDVSALNLYLNFIGSWINQNTYDSTTEFNDNFDSDEFHDDFCQNFSTKWNQETYINSQSLFFTTKTNLVFYIWKMFYKNKNLIVKAFPGASKLDVMYYNSFNHIYWELKNRAKNDEFKFRLILEKDKKLSFSTEFLKKENSQNIILQIYKSDIVEFDLLNNNDFLLFSTYFNDIEILDPSNEKDYDSDEIKNNILNNNKKRELEELLKLHRKYS